jgi:hypothetical protein
MNKALLAIVMLAFVALLVGCQQQTQQPEQQACTREAKICPDGTTVGREGPNCEFAACPTTETSTFKEYKATDLDMCSRMRYTCDEDEAFTDETGCGCVRKHQDPAVTSCITEYDPVCGKTASGNQTYSNLCMASVDSNVVSTTPGEC